MNSQKSSFLKQVPSIDISSWILDGALEDRSEVSRLWYEAYSTIGFSVITGHSISEKLFEDIREEMDSFFSLPYDHKMQFNYGKYGSPNGGFTPAGKETVGLSLDDEEAKLKDESLITSDLIESFAFTAYPSRFRAKNTDISNPFLSADMYYKEMLRVLKVIHKISCHSLCIDDLDYFDQFYFPDSECGSCAMKLSHYLWFFIVISHFKYLWFNAQ